MQDVFVIIAITGATFFLGRKLYFQFRPKKEGCDGCAMGKTENS